MILADLNQARVALQVYILNPDGSEKTDVASGTVRVYTVSGGESDVLASTPLVEIEGYKWRYEWVPVSLAVGQYVVEYNILDDEGAETSLGEDLIVRDIAEQATLSDVQSRVVLLQSDLTIVRKIESGRWRVIANQMIFYDDDGTTPFLTFDLRDESGTPTMEDVFERVPA